MTFFTPQSVRSTLGGTWIARPTSETLTGVSTDSRTIQPGQIFFALRGERFDGHDYIDAAMVAGAGLVVVDDQAAVSDEVRQNPLGVGILRVPDTLGALARLAAGYRQTLTGVRVIAVTGSNGKTTTVRLIDALLSQKLRGTASVKSYNNTIGLSLTLLSAKQTDQYLVCEVGTSSPGEIATLARIADPDIAVITTVGRAHLGNYPDQAALLAEKASLLGYLRPNGLAVISADVEGLADFAKPVPNVVRFGRADDADLRLDDVQPLPDTTGVEFRINERERCRVPLPGAHNAMNALAAVAVARRLGLPVDAIEAGLASVERAAMRFEPAEIGGVRYINDAYNASPESVLAALETFYAHSKDAQRRVLVLGDMLELGDHAEAAHREIGRAILAAGKPALLVVVGNDSLHIADELAGELPESSVVIASEMDEPASRRILGKLREGDWVLVKGSRGMRLERLIDAARRRGRGATAGAHAPSVA